MITPAKIRKTLNVLVVTAVCIAGASVSAQEDIAGKWKGEVDFPEGTEDVTVSFSRTFQDELEGSMDIPGLNLSNLTLSDIELHDDDIAFTVRDMNGSPSFKGSISDDGTTITGSACRQGQGCSFVLKHFHDGSEEE